MTSNPRIHPLCHYCGIREAGSREHLPGVAALNDRPVTVSFLSARGGRIEQESREERDGFVVRTICEKCNSRTGGNYGTAFKEFAMQFRSSVVHDITQPRGWVSLSGIQPLRVLKQLVAMFLAAQTDLSFERTQNLRDFVLRRDKKLPDEELRVSLYRNISETGRISSTSGSGFLFRRPRWDTLIASEISWPPLGVVYSYGRHPHLEGMRDITEWGQYSFKVRESFSFSVPQLRVEANWPLAYGTLQEAAAWTEQLGVVVLVTNSMSGSDPAQLSALLRQE